MKVQRFILGVACFVMINACTNYGQKMSPMSESRAESDQYRFTQQAQGGLYISEPEVSEYVNSIGQKLVKACGIDNAFEFSVIDNSTPNAWALPSGKIAVHRGLLALLRSEAELAAVLSHQIAHVALHRIGHATNESQDNHFERPVRAANSNSIFIFGEARLGTQLIRQEYDTENELRADSHGMRCMERAGYDPKAVVAWQEELMDLSTKSEKLQEFLSSHPLSERRTENVRNTAIELGSTGRIGAEHYRQVMARLITTQDAFRKLNQARDLSAKHRLDEALNVVATLLSDGLDEPKFFGFKGELLIAEGKYQAATEALDKALSLDDGYFRYYLARGIAFLELGKWAQAADDLQRSNELLPTDLAHFYLGKAALKTAKRTIAKHHFDQAASVGGSIFERAKTEFVRLDLVDRPMRYMRVQPMLSEDRELRAQIGNGTDFDLEVVKIEFKALKNAELVEKTVILPRLPANFLGVTTSGLTFDESEDVADISARIVSVSIAE